MSPIMASLDKRLLCQALFATSPKTTELTSRASQQMQAPTCLFSQLKADLDSAQRLSESSGKPGKGERNACPQDKLLSPKITIQNFIL